ncbi:MAG TPA: tripartite tricarboxylate transporter substrate binding protein [Burkholderiales bacterium]|jgi:tripartite-type tricarboxylate transporter receptor subunit TctC|nr:tripartite tricarboxylate transporter substrate binding protein [Burkholderiales bacterium]
MKTLSRLFALFFAALIAQSAFGQAWPSKPLRLIVTFPPGGTSDIAARLVGERLGARLGQPVVIDNRPGVAGILGTEAAVKSAPDGYTLLLTSTAPIAFAPSTGKPLAYDPAKDLAHIAILGTIPLALIVPVESPAKSASDVVKIAREKPGALNFSSSGNATPSHLMLERFKLSAKVQITHVPYKGSAPALNDIMAGRIDGTLDSLPALLAQIKSGKVRALAVSGRERAAPLPDVPTLAEAGFPDLVVNTWFGIAAPAATPAEIVQRLNQEILAAVQSPEVKARFDELSFVPAPMTAAETQRFIQTEIERWRPVVAAAGITFQ